MFTKAPQPSPSAFQTTSEPSVVEREFNPGSEDEAESESSHDAPAGSVGGHIQTYVRSESPAVKAKGTTKAGKDEEENPRKRLSLAEGLARAKASKAEGAKPSKKRTASKSPLREEKETRHSYQSIFDPSDEEEDKEEEEEEEGVIVEPREVSNDLDQQQEDFKLPSVCVGVRWWHRSARELPKRVLACRGELWG
ncbi:hypothetical protein PInf_024705 [Phytophthora infestans]|nr:hypothetical protein PInf_024705 [Phytophthora infestans]